MHWVPLSAALLLGLWAGRWLWKHSPAAGSDDLARWGRIAYRTTQDSVGGAGRPGSYNGLQLPIIRL